MTLPTAYQALRTQFNDRKSQNEHGLNVHLNMGESMADTHAIATQPRPDEGTVIASASSNTSPAVANTHGDAIATKINSLGCQLRSMGVLTTTANVRTPAPDQIENKPSPALPPSNTDPVYRQRMIDKGETQPSLSSNRMTEDLHPNTASPPRKFKNRSNPVLPKMLPPINTVKRGTILTSDDKILFDFETSEQYNHGSRDRLFSHIYMAKTLYRTSNIDTS
ncbi:unnamed protein product [Schistocephalus solidus]|uniref:Uncharacterized protein n=1 Tax=Schistocephalus solidus TaxID=70667 RepID=A0A183TL44_SCHSO|nr:unnamed protein product [Schistocephalus solidus]